MYSRVPPCQRTRRNSCHLFFHCPFSSSCWADLDILCSSQRNRLDILSTARQNYHKPMFMETFMIGAWNLWKERNNLVFNNIPLSKDSWKTNFCSDFSLLVHRTKSELHPLSVNLVQIF